jgi:Family of unknown function (DUF6260)
MSYAATPAGLDLAGNLDLGPVANRLVESNGDLGILRPFRGRDGRNYWERTVGWGPQGPVKKVLATNAPATLTYEQWIAIDTTVVTALMTRLKAFADIRGTPGLTYNLPNGMAHTVLRYQTVGDITPATLSMDPKRRSDGDRPQFDTAQMPLPLVHKDFDINYRELLASRNPGGAPLDLTMADLAGQKCAEMIEQLTVGTAGPFSDAGGSIYGYINFPARATKIDMVVPTGANNSDVIRDILALRQLLINNKHYGPYRLYMNGQWPAILDLPNTAVQGGPTLRQHLEAIGDIQSVDVLDTLPTTQWHVVLVEMKVQTVRAVVGLEATTVSWESLGGYDLHYKTLALMLPNLRADSASTSGIAHGRTA